MRRHHFASFVALLLLTVATVGASEIVYINTNLGYSSGCWIDGRKAYLFPDSNNQFRFDSLYSGERKLLILKRGFARIDTLIDFDKINYPFIVQLQPEEPGTLHGFINDRKGRPIPRAYVSIPYWGYEKIGKDNEGKFDISLPAGTYDVTILLPDSSKEVTASVEFQSGKTTSKTFTIPVKVNGRITGVVTNSSGNRLSEVGIRIRPSCDFTKTDQNGRYEFRNLLPDTYRLTAHEGGHEIARVIVNLSDFGESVHVPLVVDLMEFNALDVNLVVPDSSILPGMPGRISGTIQDEYGDGIIGTAVHIEEIHKGIGVMNLDGSYYLLGVPPGIYTLRISSLGYHTSTVPNVTVHSGKTTILDVVLKEDVLESPASEGCW